MTGVAFLNPVTGCVVPTRELVVRSQKRTSVESTLPAPGTALASPSPSERVGSPPPGKLRLTKVAGLAQDRRGQSQVLTSSSAPRHPAAVLCPCMTSSGLKGRRPCVHSPQVMSPRRHVQDPNDSDAERGCVPPHTKAVPSLPLGEPRRGTASHLRSWAGAST